MPQTNGIELQKQINEEFNLPVVIMPSDDRESVILKCPARGVVFHMVKPVNPDDLKNELQYAVRVERGKYVIIEKMGCTEGGSSTEKISYEDVVSASSVNEHKHSKKDSKRKASKKGKEHQEGEKTIALKKAKVVWTNSLHNRFLQAIGYISPEKAVPKKILEFMKVPGLTRENVASHLQKYRIFLKKDAVKGSATASRSSTASGRSSLTLRNVQDYAKSREKQPMMASSFQVGYGESIFSQNAAIFGSTDFPSRGASSSDTVSQAGLFGNQTSFQYESLLRNTIPLYQANQATYGTGSKGIGTDLFSRGSKSQGLMNDTKPKILCQQKPQTMSELYGNNIAASSLNNFGASTWKPSFTASYLNTSTINQDVTAGFMGNTAFPYLAPGESSSSVFDTAFAVANQEAANPSVLPPLSQQQYGHGNNGQNDFTFGQASVLGNIALPTENLGYGSNIHDLLFDLTDFQFPYQQQGGESVLNPNFPNSSYQAELNLPTNQSEVPDLSSADGVEERASWIEPSLEQLQEIEEVVNPDLYRNAYPSDYYYPNLDQNPNQQQGDGNFINPDRLHQMENSPSGNQGWDDEFLNSLLGDFPF